MVVARLLSRNTAKQNKIKFHINYLGTNLCHSADTMAMPSHYKPQVAVIGAGIAGAICSQLLARRGAEVVVFDMGKLLPGGRSSSRIPSGGATTGGPGAGSGAEFQFDYGCQFFTASSPAMKRLLDEWLAAGVAAEWRPRIGVYDVAREAVRAHNELTATEVLEVGSGGLPPLPLPGAPLYVGMPSMAALVAHVLGGGSTCDAAASGWERGGSISLRLNTQVQQARWSREGWHLAGQQRTLQTGARRRGSSDIKGDVAGPPQPVETTSSTPTGREESWEAGPFNALVLTDNQFARPGAPGYLDLQGGPPALDELTARMKDLIRVPQFALMLGWIPPGSADPPSSSSGWSAPALARGSEAATSALSQRLSFDALHLLRGTAIQWIARDSSKPGRARTDGGEAWVAITRPQFSARILRPAEAADGAQLTGSCSASDRLPQGTAPLPAASQEYQAAKAAEIWAALRQDLRGVLGSDALAPPAFISAHRWASCFTASPLGTPVVWNEEGRWAACGDFCLGPGLEGAAESGAAAAEAVANMCGLTPLPDLEASSSRGNVVAVGDVDLKARQDGAAG
ncbi:hypothetical protein VaNZ11_016685 [Volvox africanus]|uniref:Amine oxidase domain-containing protein n=1 Tax=Volvox africanus TaxID=51714 RepID=A0ABQ5SN83_9CHLO|nr:hypothetical protein VaNZ11_016685 [Volvox africanus]